MSMTYSGEVEITERDEAAHRAVMKARAKESRGQGTADADVTMELSGDDGRTVGDRHDRRRSSAARSRRWARACCRTSAAGSSRRSPRTSRRCSRAASRSRAPSRPRRGRRRRRRAAGAGRRPPRRRRRAPRRSRPRRSTSARSAAPCSPSACATRASLGGAARRGRARLLPARPPLRALIAVQVRVRLGAGLSALAAAPMMTVQMPDDATVETSTRGSATPSRSSPPRSPPRCPWSPASTSRRDRRLAERQEVALLLPVSGG